MDQPPHDAAEDNEATDEFGLPVPSPELAAMFAKTDALFEGLTQEEKLKAAGERYHDADGEPQLRRRHIRLVTD